MAEKTGDWNEIDEISSAREGKGWGVFCASSFSRYIEHLHLKRAQTLFRFFVLCFWGLRWRKVRIMPPFNRYPL